MNRDDHPNFIGSTFPAEDTEKFDRISFVTVIWMLGFLAGIAFASWALAKIHG